MEALYDEIVYSGPGDCDCKSILMAAVAKAYGFDSAVITITKANVEGHAVAGIKDPSSSFVKPETDLPPPKPPWIFLDPESVGGYYAYDCNQGRWPAGCIGSMYDETFAKTAWAVR
jgi:hypothetical protein